MTIKKFNYGLISWKVSLMINDKDIFIKNIYYMLTYAFQVLRQSNYEKIASEEFEYIQDLFAEILSKGIAQQLKQGLHRDYIAFNENLSTLRGKLNIAETIKNKIQKQQKLNCEYDELSENNIFNQILKTTINILIKDKNVKLERKNNLKKVLIFLDNVDVVDPTSIHWNMLTYQKNNKSYEMLMNICFFVLDGMLMTTNKGEHKLLQFSDEHMAKLYEKFILEYYKHHHTYLTNAKAMQVKWALDDNQNEKVIKFLPIMQTDITLQLDDKILIIDAKYYGKTMQTQYEKQTLHSHNMYQIFTYVKNQDPKNTGNVSGMLLYAKTNEDITPDCDFVMNGNKISVKTLDLNTDFKLIAKKLNEIAYNAFEIN